MSSLGTDSDTPAKVWGLHVAQLPSLLYGWCINSWPSTFSYKCFSLLAAVMAETEEAKEVLDTVLHPPRSHGPSTACFVSTVELECITSNCAAKAPYPHPKELLRNARQKELHTMHCSSNPAAAPRMGWLGEACSLYLDGMVDGTLCQASTCNTATTLAMTAGNSSTAVS